jgi:tetratricopeptide (TPR) repeat protein
MAATTSQEDNNKVTAESEEQTRGSRLAARKAAKAAQKAADKGRVPLAQSKFKQATARLYEWAADKQRAIVIALAVAVLVAGVASAWTAYSSKTGSEAADLLKKAVATSLTPTQTGTGMGEEEQKANPDVDPYESVEARASSAVKEYKAVRTQYPSSRVAAWTRIGEGNASLELGKYSEAADSFKEAVRQAQDDAYVKYRALEGMGFALEAEKKFQEAAKQFQELAKVADGAYRPYADYYLARVSLAEGQKDGAVKLLGQLLANLDRMTAEQRVHYNFVTAQATAKLLELGYDPNKIKGEDLSKTPKGEKAPSVKSNVGGAHK